jgi:hypothetical protein
VNIVEYVFYCIDCPAINWGRTESCETIGVTGTAQVPAEKPLDVKNSGWKNGPCRADPDTLQPKNFMSMQTSSIISLLVQISMVDRMYAIAEWVCQYGERSMLEKVKGK